MNEPRLCYASGAQWPHAEHDWWDASGDVADSDAPILLKPWHCDGAPVLLDSIAVRSGVTE